MSTRSSVVFLAIIEAMMAMNGNSQFMPEERHSVNEIVEKSDVTEGEVLELLEAEIIKGTTIFGVPYIVGDTLHSVERKLKDWKGRINDGKL